MKPSGYRRAVSIVLANLDNQVLVARRLDLHNQWQFPQGGIDGDEKAVAAALREMEEEIGVDRQLVTFLNSTEQFLRYEYPQYIIEQQISPKFRFIGQALKFFLMRFHGDSSDINVHAVAQPEFDSWKWVKYWEPVQLIVDFKQGVYRTALTELEVSL